MGNTKNKIIKFLNFLLFSHQKTPSHSQNLTSHMMNSFSKGQLQIKTKTWSRDSYGLFDYETSTLNIQNLTVTGACDLARKDNEITSSHLTGGLVNDKRETTADLKETPMPLATVYDSPDGIKIASTTKDKGGPDDFWFVVERGENVDGYKVKVNDVIRIGRVGFKITQIKMVAKHEGMTNPTLPQKSIISTIKEHMKEDDNREIPKEAERKMSASYATCKICLSEQEEDENPLISPCACIGSVRYTHLQCMQNWIKSKLNMQQNKNIITIYWKNLYCELCKQKLPINVVHNDEELSLIPIGNKITGSYVIMESFSKEKDSTGIHLIDLSSNQNFKMGRGHDCDLKIHDISVSRVHALLVVSRGSLYLKDNMSKFGTLVLQRGPVVVNDETPVSSWIQCGRTIFKFTLKQSWLAKIPCVGSLFGFNKTVKLEDKLLEDTDRGDITAQYTQPGEESKRLTTKGEHE